ncbi:MAG: hypothetical protein KAG89_02290 [Fulvimarina manganoxydans]|uniref:hypothetical protein n=1 Tax=Fulvimarina manganoxydans TaxID=937218 RepID=UPI002354EB7A|nr:hypothetical protein [Fulvimarina manganoxydans]MCK5930974.1 hypothetical protein [Fulvimarina manganoxydans]
MIDIIFKSAVFAVLSMIAMGLAGCGSTPPAANCFSYASENEGPCQFEPLGPSRWDQFDG